MGGHKKAATFTGDNLHVFVFIASGFEINWNKWLTIMTKAANPRFQGNLVNKTMVVPSSSIQIQPIPGDIARSWSGVSLVKFYVSECR